MTDELFNGDSSYLDKGLCGLLIRNLTKYLLFIGQTMQIMIESNDVSNVMNGTVLRVMRPSVSIVSTFCCSEF